MSVRDHHTSRLHSLGKLRFAHVLDAPHIANFLINESMALNFRVDNEEEITRLFEESVLSIVQMDTERNVVGCLVVKDYPLIPSLYSSAWEEFIWNKYKASELNARNTLFIHLMCFNHAYGRAIVDSMLRSVFMHDPYVHYICMVKSLPEYSLLVPGQSRIEASFKRLTATERDVAPEKLPVLCVGERKEICPRMRVRRAVEEDNDDLIPIIDRHSKRLRELYGDFYISELIARHPESDRVLLVCEHKELAVGVLALNTQINYEVLEESYDLAPFAGLRRNAVLFRPPPKEHLAESFANFESVCGMETIEDVMTSEKTEVAASSVADETIEQTEEMPMPSWFEMSSLQFDYSFAEATLLSLLLANDEDIEFEIVNIDPAYLTRTSLLPLPEDFTVPETTQQRKDSTAPRVVIDVTKKRSKRMSVGQLNICKLDQIVRYTGDPNAFLIELCAVGEDIDERYAFDMLEAAFEVFPDREYCILCLPSSHTCFPLLEHFTLVTPHCTNMRFANESLFVAHKTCVRGEIRVRRAEACDLHHIMDIAEHVPRAEQVTALFQESLVTNTHCCFLLMTELQPLGFCIVGPLDERGSIRAQYTLDPEPRKPGTDCSVLCGVVSPIMEPHARWFMREVIRHSQYRTLFYQQVVIGTEQAKAEAPRINMNSLTEKMMPVRQRLVIPNITGHQHLDDIFKTTGPPFSLWVLERPLTSLPKVYVNNSIVVVGGSRTGLAFLETLILGPTSSYLTFTNLTLVSDNCLVMFADVLKAANTCIPGRGRLTAKYLRTVPFSVYVDTIADIMVRIDRKNKCIYLKGGGVKYYDDLVLTCGIQYQHPEYMKKTLIHEKEVRAGKPCERMLMDDPGYLPDQVPQTPELPDNVMLINSLFQANLALRKLLHMVNKDKRCLSPERPIVVYGECLELYTCMAALLELGVEPPCLTFVEPFPAAAPNALRVNTFNDELVDGRVQQSLMELGIHMIHEHKLMDWKLIARKVVSIRLMGPLSVLTLKCFALFYFGRKGININAFRAINEAGLVYDGGVVVSPLFETNDPSVRAAGPCCTYSRRLYAANEVHTFYQSEEIGAALAHIMIRKLNPFTMGDTDLSECPSDLFPRYSNNYLSTTLEEDPCVLGDCTNRTWQPVMKFKQPLTSFAKLPGPLYYFKMRKPGSETPMVVENYLPRKGHKLVTDKDGNFFCLKLNSLHCVDGITCLSTKPFVWEIFHQVFGKHEAFFNKLLAKYQLNQIDDFFEYFTQPWMSALYQETFNEDVLTYVRKLSMEPLYQKLQESGEFAATCDSCKCSEKRLECGQRGEARTLAERLWLEHNGEEAVISAMKRYFTRNVDTNPHYAPPRLHTTRRSKTLEQNEPITCSCGNKMLNNFLLNNK